MLHDLMPNWRRAWVILTLAAPVALLAAVACSSSSGPTGEDPQGFTCEYTAFGNGTADISVPDRERLSDFDFFIMEFRFTDARDGRAIASSAPFETFEGVGVSLEPLSVPGDGPESLEAAQ